MNKAIAFFDFDGTITNKDTFLEFIKYKKGTSAFYIGMFFNIPILVGLKLGIVSKQKAKERLLSYFFKNEEIINFNKFCFEFSQSVVRKMIRKQALNRINSYLENNVEVVIVSASPENWIVPWANSVGIFSIIATKLEICDSKITGLIDGKNCNGPEKVKRILENYKIEEYSQIDVFGDTSGDKEMLNLANNKYYRVF